MNHEINKKLETLLDQYTYESTGLEEFKFMILDYEAPIIECKPFVEQLVSVAEKKQDSFGMTYAYVLMFIVLFQFQIEDAIAYNQKAESICLENQKFQDHLIYLSIRNNKLRAYLMKEQYKEAYQELVSCISMVQEKGYHHAYPVFMSNGSVMLSEFGLYKKAIQLLEELTTKKSFHTDVNLFVCLYKLGYLYVYSKNKESLSRLLHHRLVDCEEELSYLEEPFLFLYLEEAILYDHPTDVEARYLRILNSYHFDQHTETENCDYEIVMGHYHIYHRQYTKALTLYLRVLEKFNQKEGNKRVFFEELSFIYEKLGDEEQAYRWLLNAHTRLQYAISFIDGLYQAEMEDVWEHNRKLSYDALYQKLMDIIEFGKEISDSVTWQKLMELTNEKIPALFAYEEAMLFLYDGEDKLQSSENDLILLSEHPYVQQCLEHKKMVFKQNIASLCMKNPRCHHLYENGIKSVVLQPILHNKKVIALFYMGTHQVDNFGKTSQGLLQILANYMGIALHNVEQFEQALEKSTYDYLSGLYNRSALMQYGELMIKDAKKQRKSIGALMMDIDNFKITNDTYGHMKGDKVIEQLSSILKEQIREGIIARYGGEEFFFLKDDIELEELDGLAERIRRTCEETPIFIGQVELHFTISIGGCVNTLGKLSLNDMIKIADEQLYCAKHAGKNCVYIKLDKDSSGSRQDETNEKTENN